MTPRALARANDPATAHEAAAAVTPRLTALERRVLAAMAALGRPCTSHEIAGRAGLDLVTVSPRMRSLCDRGLVREAGRQRPAEGGVGRTLWALPDTPTRQVA